MKRYILILGVIASAGLWHTSANAQVLYQFLPAGTATWNSDASWENPNGQNFVPGASFNEGAVINSGGTAFVDASVSDVGSVLLGETVLGSGHLEIRNGGTLNATAATGGSGTPLTGPVTVGGLGLGTLTVLPGGTLTTAATFVLSANLANNLTVGASSGASNATLTVASATLDGTSRTYPNAAFTSNGTLTFGSSSAYTAEINGSSAATLDAVGTATLGGSLNANFAGTPTLGSSWALVEAGSIAGSFTSFTSNAALASGQSLFLSTTDIAGGRQRLDLNLEEVLVLEVNRNSGNATIRQPGGTTISLDGYSILSSQGSLQVAGWNSLADQGALGGGWTESNPTLNALNELNSAGSGSLASGQSVSVGSVYDSYAVPFGFTDDDLTFEYTTPGGGTFNGIVELSGTFVNNLILQIDPNTGQGRLRNPTSTPVSIDAYTIESASGSIESSTWSSLDDQNSAGGDWLELFSPPNDNMVGEVKPVGGTATGPGGDGLLGIGGVFDTSGTRDLVFQYKVEGQLSAALGTVVYQEIVDNPADLNLDGRVNGLDFLLAQQEPNPTAAIATWQANYGFVEGVSPLQALQSVSSVPEPASATMTLLLIGVSVLWRENSLRAISERA